MTQRSGTARVFTAEDLGQAAREVATMTALVLIREGGDTDAAIEMLAEFSLPVEGDEVLDVAAISAQAIGDPAETRYSNLRERLEQAEIELIKAERAASDD